MLFAARLALAAYQITSLKLTATTYTNGICFSWKKKILFWIIQMFDLVI